MKRMIALAAALVILAAMCACGSEPDLASATSGPYKDGAYQYCGKDDVEGYHVEASMAVDNGRIESMEWKIVDDNRKRVFDETYEEVYGLKLYIQQCRDNWSGMQSFVPALLEKQDPEEVDAVSGATWAYKKFEEAAKALLAQAEK